MSASRSGGGKPGFYVVVSRAFVGQNDEILRSIYDTLRDRDAARRTEVIAVDWNRSNAYNAIIDGKHHDS